MNLKMFYKSILIILASIILGFLLLSLVYCIPTRLMVDAGYDSNGIFVLEGVYPTDHMAKRNLDNFTDALMLGTAAYSGTENPLEKAIFAYRHYVSGMDPVDSYIEIFSDSTDEVAQADYPRYWHGYLVFLKPIYAFFNYMQIRDMNRIIQYSLLIAVFLLMYKKAKAALFPFAIAILYLAPTTICQSLQYSSVYYITLLSVFLILLNPRDMLNNNKIIYLFLLSGISTAFLDLLTFPSLSLTVPLCILCVMIKEMPARSALKMLLSCCLAWFIGYAGMWAGKWLLATLVGGREFIDSLRHSIEVRSSATNNTAKAISRLDALKSSVNTMFGVKDINIFTLIFAAMSAIILIAKRKSVRKSLSNTSLLLIIPMAISFLWMLGMCNHTYVHSFFTYRTAIPIVLCPLLFLSLAVEAASESKALHK